MVQLSRSRFAELVEEALDTLPEPLARLVDNVVVQIEARDPDDPGLLGLYVGTALTERGHDYTFAAPDTITIFRDAICAVCEDEEQAAREVAVTVVHEIGHHFGLDDERLHELGWG